MNEREVEAVARALLNARMPKHEANWERVADSARLAYSNDARAAITALDAACGRFSVKPPVSTPPPPACPNPAPPASCP